MCVQLWVAHSLWLVIEFDYCMCTRKYSFSNKQVAAPRRRNKEPNRSQ